MPFRILLALLSTLLAGIASDWPQFLGPGRDGTYPGDGLARSWPREGPRRAWQHAVGSGWSGPVAAQGRVVIFHRRENREVVDCLDLDTGNPLWQADFATAYVDGFGFDNGPRSTPVIQNGRVVVMGAEGGLHCLDIKTGKILWTRSLRSELKAPTGYFGLACSPLIAGRAVLLNVGAPGDGGIVAFDLQTGKTLWRATDDEASYSSPIAATLDGVEQAVFFTRHNLFGIVPQSGKVLWQRAWSPAMQASVSAAVPVVAGDVMFATASYGAGAIALRYRNGQITRLWENDESLSCQYQTPLLHAGHLYGFHGRLDTGPRPEFRCVELTTGRVRWSSSKVDAGSLIRIGKEALLLTTNGELIRLELSTEGLRVHSRTQVLGLEQRAHPALAQGRYLARDKSRLVCVDLR